MKNLRLNLSCWLALLAILFTAIAPATVSAQSWNNLRNRQEKKNEWRNLAYAGAALAALGLISKNNTLTLAGVAGGLYSLHRYEQDRKSQSRLQRQRAQLFSRSRIYVNGKPYVRRTVRKNGQSYYTFVRAR